MRIALGVEYNGTHHAGWQIQPSQRTVQGCLEDALSRVANHSVKTVAAGRTDSGVHALQQVVHFDTDVERDERNWILGLNTNLPADINVTWAKPVDEDFSARFSALNRSYRYLILNRVSRSALQDKRMWWFFRPLDEQRMQAAADLLVGHHDFSAFRAKECQAKSPMKTMEKIQVTRYGQYIAVDVKAQSFLHHMVRNIVGVLVPIGEGKEPVSWAKSVLESRARAQGGITSPPDGLYFMNVEYPAKYALPTVSALPMVW
ncbi:MAG: tRNA pseudouridine(38-40) synthase TruA [Gammaproteobacteria bacterium]|nr:tRNA pseudouridine(38-40) synthase TruA [Gammaproteobacteria bacterium]MDH5591876.1 tRNA pseudouridine(38-40) synthase TruA [Gammaproteobacteria bacterium]